MGNDKHEELSSTSGRWSDRRLRLGAVGAIIGGVLLAINTVWQGYLDLTPGGDAFLHESTTQLLISMMACYLLRRVDYYSAFLRSIIMLLL